MTDLSFLEKVDVFKGLTDQQLQAVAEKCKTMDLTRDDQLFSQGSPSTHLFFVVEGEIDLRQDADNKNLTSPPSTKDSISFISNTKAFGWTCFVPPYKYRLTAICASRTATVIQIAKTDLDNLFQTDASLGHQVMAYLTQVVGRHFQEYQNQVAEKRGHEIMNQW